VDEDEEGDGDDDDDDDNHYQILGIHGKVTTPADYLPMAHLPT